MLEPGSEQGGIAEKGVSGELDNQIVRVAQEIYAGEVGRLKTKSTVFGVLGDVGFGLALPGSLYIIGKFLGIDIEEIIGFNISESADSLIRLSSAIAFFGAGAASCVQIHFEEKLNSLKKMAGVLPKSGDQEGG